jgi:hypothetical protein
MHVRFPFYLVSHVSMMGKPPERFSDVSSLLTRVMIVLYH